MAREILNALSTVEIVFVFVGGSIVLAIALTYAIRKLAPDVGERQFEELAGGLRIVYELLFALILAFVIASVLDKFNDAQTTVDSEATALALMLRDNRAFPSEREARINAGIDAYVDALVNDEWETMRHGDASREADAALDTVYALYQDYRPADGVADKFYDQALVQLDVVAAARRERLGISAARLPTILVLMLPIGALLLLVLEYRPKLTPLSQAGFMGTLALVLSSTYLLTILLDYPFSGDVSVGNEPLLSGSLAYLAGSEPREPRARRQAAAADAPSAGRRVDLGRLRDASCCDGRRARCAGRTASPTARYAATSIPTGSFAASGARARGASRGMTRASSSGGSCARRQARGSSRASTATATTGAATARSRPPAAGTCTGSSATRRKTSRAGRGAIPTRRTATRPVSRSPTSARRPSGSA